MAELCILEQPLPGVFLLECPYFPAQRGDFVNLFHSEVLAAQGISFKPEESFLTRSKKNVLRGMHFQVGKAAHDKLVTCIKGRVLDVIVDVQHGSPNFNQPFAIELSELSNLAIIVGKGYAHGFLTLCDDSWMFYSTTTVHAPSLDRGIFWNSIAFDWPTRQPLLSVRDETHPSIDQCQEEF